MSARLAWLAADAAQWAPLWQGAGFFLATFVLEDAATVGAGLLLGAGAVAWPVAFISCFLGIWAGDAGLYALARFAGRNWFERSSFRKYSASVARSEKWFDERGAAILLVSRCVPGARLPTNLAAGFLRWPARRFLLISGLAAFFWTAFMLWLAGLAGKPLVGWLAACQHRALAAVAGVLAVLAAVHGLHQLGKRFDCRRFCARLARWRHWEFWPAWLFYPPVALYCVWLAVKYRGIGLPTVANPGIFSGGLVGESKFATLKNLMATSPEFTAAAEFIPARKGSTDGGAEKIPSGWFAKPFILKPDLGQRGSGVKLIRTRAQVEDYFRHTSAPLLAQEYAPGPHEAGIFYYRFPGERAGRIFNITEKIFPDVAGDGQRTLRELIEADPRARMIAEKYFNRFPGQLDTVPAAGSVVKLVEAGNHAQGCIFRDGTRMATPELAARIDEISQRLDGFFIGRYDVRYAREEDLRAGKNFQIVELNGAAAEASAIYDARYTLWSAYRTLFKQWDLVFAIGAENRRRGARTVGVLTMWRHWRNYGKMAASYPPAD